MAFLSLLSPFKQGILPQAGTKWFYHGGIVGYEFSVPGEHAKEGTEATGICGGRSLCL